MSEPVRILTIEDDAAIRASIVAYLSDSGFEMLQANDGHNGLEIFRSAAPDLVLCDLRVPGLDGLHVLSTIGMEAPETPVIVVSGARLVSDAVQALKRGAWDFVTKPIEDMEILERAIARALERARLLRENRENRAHLETLNRRLKRALGQFEEDQQAGRRIQSELLPTDGQRFGEYRFSRRLFPSIFLSGDFVDYFSIDERRVGFYIADVAGHGAASAFIAVMVKTLIRQYLDAWGESADFTIVSPRLVLQRLHRDLLRQDLGKHATIFYAVIDCEEHVMVFSGGGHYPFPMVHDGHSLQVLPTRSCPVGLFPQARFEDRYVPLPDRFAMLLVSDGVLEILPQSSLSERRTALQAQLRGPDSTVEELVVRLGLEQIEELPDDVALLVINRQADNEQA